MSSRYAYCYQSVAAPIAFIGIRELAWLILHSGVPMAWLNVLEKGGHTPKELFSQLLYKRNNSDKSFHLSHPTQETSKTS